MVRSELIVVWLSIFATSLPAAAAGEEPSREPAVCAALTARDEALLAHLPREFIEDVEKLVETHVPSPFETERARDGENGRLRGATIMVHAVEGLTAERLQRLVRCGLLRAAAADPRRPSDWPRTPPGTRAEVYSGYDRFIVMLRAEDAAAAEALWETARQLKPSRVSRAPPR